MEVVNLCLDERKLWAVQSEGPKYFHPDAWLAFQNNINHKCNDSGVVLPVLSDSDERFWLFYTTVKLGKVLKAGVHTPLTRVHKSPKLV